MEPALAVLIGYVALLFTYGLMKAGRVRTANDFALAGRSLSPVVLIGTLLATWIGTGSIFGSAEKVYEVGLAAWFLPISSLLGIAILARLAQRIRAVEGTTVQDILEARFGVAARVLGSIILIAAYVTIVSYQYRAAGLVLDLAVPSLGKSRAIEVAAIVIVSYTAIAGLKSVAHTDVLNGVLMIAGVAVLIPTFFVEIGGFDGLRTALPDERQQFFGPVAPLSMLGIFLPTFLLVLGDANMYQRFFAARDPQAARRAARWLVLGVGAMEFGIIALAYLASALEPNVADPGRVIAYAGMNHLPELGAGLLLAVIFAIIVSTADSFLLVSSTCLTHDVFERFIAPRSTENLRVWAARGAVLLLGGLAYWLSTQSDEFLSVALYAYTMYGAAITPSLLAALLWPRATRSAALVSIVSGMAVTLGWEFSDWGRGTGIDTVLPAIVASTTALVVVSYASSSSDSPKRPASDAS